MKFSNTCIPTKLAFIASGSLPPGTGLLLLSSVIVTLQFFNDSSAFFFAFLIVFKNVSSQNLVFLSHYFSPILRIGVLTFVN